MNMLVSTSTLPILVTIVGHSKMCSHYMTCLSISSQENVIDVASFEGASSWYADYRHEHVGHAVPGRVSVYTEFLWFCKQTF